MKRTGTTARFNRQRRAAFTGLGIAALFVQLACAGNLGELPAEAVLAVPARDVLVRGQQPSQSIAAYGYLLFLSQPSDETVQDYHRICNLFQQQIPKRRVVEASDGVVYMVTFWLLAAGVDTEDCKSWVDNYDYDEAQRIAARAGRLSRKGPLLVAWSRPWEELRQGEEGLMFDLSKVADGDLEELFRVWRQAIVEKPEVWNGLRINLAKARFWFVDSLEEIADELQAEVEKLVREVFANIKWS